MYTLLVVVLTTIVVGAVIYLTPLKHINLIEPQINDITPTEFYEKYKGNEDHYIFIDVRGESSYNNAHAAGSINMPLHTLYNQRKVLPKNGKEIVLICSGGVASGVGHDYLHYHGFFNIARIGGGIEAWQEAGLPVESGVN